MGGSVQVWRCPPPRHHDDRYNTCMTPPRLTDSRGLKTCAEVHLPLTSILVTVFGNRSKTLKTHWPKEVATRSLSEQKEQLLFCLLAKFGEAPFSHYRPYHTSFTSHVKKIVCSSTRPLTIKVNPPAIRLQLETQHKKLGRGGMNKLTLGMSDTSALELPHHSTGPFSRKKFSVLSHHILDHCTEDTKNRSKIRVVRWGCSFRSRMHAFR